MSLQRLTTAIALLILPPVAAFADQVVIRDASELQRELGRASPGRTLLLAPGVYKGDKGFVSVRLKGAKDAPIIVRGESADNPPVIEGGIFLRGARWVTFENLHLTNAPVHLLNADDGSSGGGGLVFRNIVFEVSPNVNSASVAGLKLTRLDSIRVENCTFIGWKTAAIDMVGIHGGVVEHNQFLGQGIGEWIGILMKGGTRDVVVRDNYFEDAGQRVVQAGGQTGGQFFRQEPVQAEAEDIDINGNIIVRGDACVSFSSQRNTHFHHNICYLPKNFIVRVLQDNGKFPPSSSGRVDHNLFVYDNSVSQANEFVNVGRGVAIDTFVFEQNAYFQTDGYDADLRKVPVPEEGAAIQVDPLLIDAGTSAMKIGSTDAAYAGIGPAGRSTAEHGSLELHAVLEAAGFSDSPPAAGALASLFGAFAGVPTLAASAVPLPTSLSGLRVVVAPVGDAAPWGLRSAPLLFASNDQINVQLPWELDPGADSYEFSVVLDGRESNGIRTGISRFCPRVFTLGSGSGPALALNANDSIHFPTGRFRFSRGACEPAFESRRDSYSLRRWTRACGASGADGMEQPRG